MTGIERPRELIKDYRSGDECRSIACGELSCGKCMAKNVLEPIADQIERETQPKRDPVADVSMSAYDLLPQEDRDAIAWVRDHGGLDAVKRRWECLSFYADPVPRSYAERRIAARQRQIDESHAALRRRNELIAELNARVENQRAALDGLVNSIDEMRPRLMPEGMEWPRFEDGAQVKFGDVVSDGDETGRVYYVTFDTVNPVIIGFTDETPDQDPGTWLEVSVSDGERVNRPAPKVLDSDGVEIRVGDTVCGTRDMEPMTVVDTDSRECGFKRIKCEKEGDGFWFYCPNELTHRSPVLAADGRPLREGEHVWHVETGTELVVKELPKPREYQAVVVFAPPASHLTSFDPDRLTHERPDSKCRDCAHWQKDPSADTMGVCWFLYHEYEGEDCYAARRADIGACDEFVPRAKALAERGR